ncbi:MAG: exosortase C-terminal domain/associated protein EpsI, partial [Syntrophobacteraceae bacterium]
TLLVISTVPLAILLNGLRIGFTGIALNTWGTAVTEGFSHDFSGWIVFMVSLALLLGEMWLLGGRGRLFHKENTTKASGQDIQGENSQESPQSGEARRVRRFPGLMHASVAVLLLGGTLALSSGIDFHQGTPLKKPFFEFPLHFGGWEGSRQSLEQKIISDLDISDYILANFQNGDSKSVNFYVAYYETQSKGKSIHTPATCLPGSGWAFKEAGTVSIPLPAPGGNSSIYVSRALMQKDDMNQLVYYWFPQRGRVLTNVYQLKLYAFWDALTRRRLDGALVRLVTPVSKNESINQAEARLQEFIMIILPKLDDFIPGE